MNNVSSCFWAGGGILFADYYGFLAQGVFQSNRFVLALAIACCVLGLLTCAAKK